MNIYTVRDNLILTIEGKQQMLDELIASDKPGFTIIQQSLKNNIEELTAILADVEICCEQYNRMGWEINPERMGR